jgi:hypothetical protein
MKHRSVWVLALSVAVISPVVVQQYVYPAKGQSAQQQNNDEATCYQWAVQQAGFDPAKAQALAAPPTTAAGSTPGAGARGAVGGAAIGAIAGDAGAGAAAGAEVARSQSRRQNAAAGQQQAATPQQQAVFGKARAACLEDTGYAVK